ncbi:MAG TPA: rRNA maturation RNase YbeY [Candidatus Paceibacterota bacterium]|nr:rRNA maturation RNase YbeY [Candidatus Paceibacterota bacterium]
MNIAIANRQQTRKFNLRLLKKIAGALLAELKIENAELGINLVGARDVALINETFLKHEGSTDVITFDYLNPESRIQNPEPQLHGELFVCVDEAVLQARKFKTIWQSEIVRYIVHGVLHLLGHDDLKPDLRRKMKLEENRLLRGLSRKFSLAQIARRSKIPA